MMTNRVERPVTSANRRTAPMMAQQVNYLLVRIKPPADVLIDARKRPLVLAGGSWLTALTSDLGAGKSDGAYLVENFETLNPSTTLWTTNYNVWSNVDTKASRFLEFERWWGQ